MKKNKVRKGEVLLYSLGAMCFICTLLIKVFLGASIGNQQMMIEKLKYDISEEEKSVESLTMQVQELISFDNVEKVVKDLGLAYNNNNIIVVDN